MISIFRGIGLVLTYMSQKQPPRKAVSADAIAASQGQATPACGGHGPGNQARDRQQLEANSLDMDIQFRRQEGGTPSTGSPGAKERAWREGQADGRRGGAGRILVGGHGLITASRRSRPAASGGKGSGDEPSSCDAAARARAPPLRPSADPRHAQPRRLSRLPGRSRLAASAHQPARRRHAVLEARAAVARVRRAARRRANQQGLGDGGPSCLAHGRRGADRRDGPVHPAATAQPAVAVAAAPHLQSKAMSLAKTKKDMRRKLVIFACILTTRKS